ncbi:MAG: phosphatidate cytidylyltransferase [Eubacteriales bacterium]|nr:phosphatidate cytidylyltransferase [Eubacteriales bacterium]
MLKRIITGVFLIIYAFGLVTLGAWYPIAVDVLIYSFMLLGVYEMLHSFSVSGYKVYKIAPIIMSVSSFPLVYFFGLVGLAVDFAICLMIVMIQFIFAKDRTLNDLFASIFTMIYPALFMSVAFVITREVNAVYVACFAILVPVASDSFAYFVGRLVKGPKLCPTISPKKTISGAVGGLMGGVLASGIVYTLFEHFAVFGDMIVAPLFTPNHYVNLAIYLVIGLLGSVICQLGDLFASRIKRCIGIKDFGKIFPGHGGGLDRLDSIMFMLVVLFVIFSFV